jgi:2-keto-4-pentenoate hydratase/2-oxohepta-3-ene-1,7-dioic acid hydratase in catechol pathway
MEFRRRLVDASELVVESRETSGEEWSASSHAAVLGYESPFSPEWELRQATSRMEGDGTALPFQPLSFRDFMLFEQHNINAARGWVGRYRPRLARSARVFESVTKSIFPPYKPKPLWYRQPTYYMSNASTVVPSGVPVTAPPYDSALDYELELGFVLREPLFNATPAEAEAAIGAFFVLCDFSVREVQIPEMDSGFGPQKSKHFLTSLSPTAVDAASVLDRWTQLSSRVVLNGEVISRPDSTTPQWSLGEALAHCSAGEQLYPGELFATGTYVNGCGMEIGAWLKPGDTIRLEIDEVGVIEHPIY